MAGRKAKSHEYKDGDVNGVECEREACNRLGDAFVKVGACRSVVVQEAVEQRGNSGP